MKLLVLSGAYINLDNVAYFYSVGPEWAKEKDMTKVVFSGLSKEQELLLNCTAEELEQEIRCQVTNLD